jgi:hypothetical protein
MYDAASTCCSSGCRRSTASAGHRRRQRAARRCASSSIPPRCSKYGIGLEDVRAALAPPTPTARRARSRRRPRYRSTPTTRRRKPRTTAADRRLPQRRRGAAVRRRRRQDSVEDLRNRRPANGKPAVLVILFRQPGANIIDTVDRVKAELPQLQGGDAGDVERHHRGRPHATIRASLHDTSDAGDRRRAGDPGGVRVPARTCAPTLIPASRAGVAHRHLRRDVSARLQPRQSVADGADDRDRLRRRRRDRRAREHLAPHRGGDAAPARRRCSARARSASPCCR